MITAVDTNILIDILAGMPKEAYLAQTALDRAGSQGRLMLSVVCYAELAGYFDARDALDDFLASSSFRVIPLFPTTAFLAGSFHKEYRRRGGRRARVLADFLIGAQAQLQADRLITNDTRFFGETFPGLLAVSASELV